MFITSTINTLTRSSGDVPIIVLRHGQTRKFIQRPETYEVPNDTFIRVADLISIPFDQNLVAMALETFEFLDPSVLTFTTSTLDICQGNPIEINAGVYPLLYTCVDEIAVVIVEVAVPDRRNVGMPTALVVPVRNPISFAGTGTDVIPPPSSRDPIASHRSCERKTPNQVLAVQQERTRPPDPTPPQSMEGISTQESRRLSPQKYPKSQPKTPHSYREPVVKQEKQPAPASAHNVKPKGTSICPS